MSGAARRAATDARPALATFTNGRPSASRPSSSRRSSVPVTASVAASSGSSGSPDARTKSFAVPPGITPSGTPSRPASSAELATVPSPPATAIRSGESAAARSRSASSQPNTVTSAPRSRIARASGSGSSPEPDARLAISAMRTGGQATLRAVFERIDHIGVAVDDLDAAIALHEQTYDMRLVHRETVTEQGVEAVLLDVGENHVELLLPLADDTPVGRVPRQARPGPAPRRLPGGRHRRGARPAARPRRAADRRDAAHRDPRIARRVPASERHRRRAHRARRTANLSA